MVKRVGKYEIGKTLGEGTFGKVKYAVNTETGEKVGRSEYADKLRALAGWGWGWGWESPAPVLYACALMLGNAMRSAFASVRSCHSPRPSSPTALQVAIKILDKEKIQKQNMGSQIKKEVRLGGFLHPGLLPRHATTSDSDLDHESRQARLHRQAV